MKSENALKFQLKKLDQSLSKASFEGFTLQKGYWYGYNLRGLPIATSTFSVNGYVLIYTKSENGRWISTWYDNEWCKYLLPGQFYEEVFLSNEETY